jgi:phthiocerol/phenolphthiocerol synthesis type-I polyketide synthase E
MARSLTGALPLELNPTGDETTRRLSRIWQELLGLESVGLDQNYFDLGGDSPLAVHLFTQIEKAFGIKLPLATLFEAPTIEKLAEVLRGKAAVSGWSPLVAIQPYGSRPPFFCVHGAGGNVFIYRDLSRLLGSDQPFYGLQCQGLDGKQVLLTRIEDMAELYTREIQRFQAHGPYYLGGYCMGGTVAFEIAQRLTARGEQVAMLALFDTLDWSKVDMKSKWAKLSFQVQRLGFHLGNFILLDSRDKMKFFVEKWKILRSRATIWRGLILNRFMKGGVNKSESYLLAKIWKNSDQAAGCYVPRPLNAPIVEFRPLKQYSMYQGPDINWKNLARKGQEIVNLPVYPAGMLLEPFVQHLAAALRQQIDSAVRSSESH